MLFAPLLWLVFLVLCYRVVCLSSVSPFPNSLVTLYGVSTDTSLLVIVPSNQSFEIEKELELLSRIFSCFESYKF